MNAPEQLRPSLKRIAKISLAVGVCGGTCVCAGRDP